MHKKVCQIRPKKFPENESKIFKAYAAPFYDTFVWTSEEDVRIHCLKPIQESLRPNGLTDVPPLRTPCTYKLLVEWGGLVDFMCNTKWRLILVFHQELKWNSDFRGSLIPVQDEKKGKFEKEQDENYFFIHTKSVKNFNWVL